MRGLKREVGLVTAAKLTPSHAHLGFEMDPKTMSQVSQLGERKEGSGTARHHRPDLSCQHCCVFFCISRPRKSLRQQKRTPPVSWLRKAKKYSEKR